MLNVGIIGVGNTGNQIAELAHDQLKIDTIAINSSEKDLETINGQIPKILISDKSQLSKGAGKDRGLAKKYLKDSVMSLLKEKSILAMASEKDVIFVISSTGGGTGSGTAPLLANILTETAPDTKIILVGVLPVNNEALSAQVNTLEYLNELYKVLDKPTYMLYDNDKLSNLPSYKIMETVNAEIVQDINVLKCTYNFTTKYDSIDDRDMMRLLSFPGRIVVSRLEDFSEKDAESSDIEERLIDNIRRNCHVESQRDKKVMATGVITNLSRNLTEEFDNNVPKVRDFSGVPVHAFNHIYVNEDRKQPNKVFYIMAGLSPVNDKINLISDRIAEIEEAQKTLEDDDALEDIQLDSLSDQIKDKEEEKDSEANISDIFSKFNI